MGICFFLSGDSFVPPEVDFDRLLASLQDLSELVVEGEAQVTPMPGGAQFRTLEPIPIKLYRNGMMMFDGPFRPFYDPSTQVGWGSGIHTCSSPLLGDGGVHSLYWLALLKGHRPHPSSLGVLSISRI